MLFAHLKRMPMRSIWQSVVKTIGTLAAGLERKRWRSNLGCPNGVATSAIISNYSKQECAPNPLNYAMTV